MFSFPQISHFSNVGWVGVEIFFVLSGFVIAYSSHSATASSFLMGRVARLVPAAWICASLTLLALLFASHESRLILVLRWVRTLLFCPIGRYTDGAFWTLPIEVSFYAFIFAKIRFAPKMSFDSMARAIGLTSAAFWLVCLLIGHGADGLRESRYTALLLLHHGCQFALGMQLYLVLIDRFTVGRLLTAGACAIASIAETLASASIKRIGDPTMAAGQYPVLIWVAAMTLIVLAVRYNPALCRVFGRFSSQIRLLGLATYPLYLVHQNAGAYFMLILHKSGVAPGLCAAAAMILAFAVAILIVKYCEPPARALLRRLLSSKNFGGLFGDFEPKGLKPLPAPVGEGD